MNIDLVLLVVSFFALFLLAWGIGSNDLANIMSTSLGSQAISVKNALLIAIIFECIGSLFGGVSVAHTIRDNILQSELISSHNLSTTIALIAVLLSGTSWMLLATFFGLPASLTNAIVGGLIGFSIFNFGINAIKWHHVGFIGFSWLFSPLCSGILAYIVYRSIQKTILSSKNIISSTKKYITLYFFLVGFVIAFVMILKIIKYFHFNISDKKIAYIIAGVIFFITCLGTWFTHKILARKTHLIWKAKFAFVERIFGILMVFTASSMAFAHGSNDISVGTGLMASILESLNFSFININYKNLMPFLTLFSCIAVSLGLFFSGKRVINTVGKNITVLSQSSAFAATISAATITSFSTSFGIPLSVTQTLVGAVFGVGLARSVDAINLKILRNILFSWFITIPVTSILSLVYFYFIRLFY